jgi:hypothetical protein
MNLFTFELIGDRIDGCVPSLFHVLAEAVQFIESVLIDALTLQVFFRIAMSPTELINAALLCCGDAFT